MPDQETIVTARLESKEFEGGEVAVFSVRGRESISQLFDFEIGIASTESEAFDPDELSGADACLVFERDGEEVRRIYGLLRSVERIYALGAEEAKAYIVSLVPSAYRMTLVHTQEIYQHLNVVEITQKKLELVDLSAQANFSTLLSSYPSREFVVQYDETDFAFVCRRLEHVGISFYFTHDSAKAQDDIVFVDDNSGFGEGSPLSLRGRAGEVGLQRLTHGSRVIPRLHVVMDYNYRTPDVELLGQHESDHGWAGAVLEWGHHFKTPAEGESMARVRAQERAATRNLFKGESNVCELSAGYRYPLEDHDELEGTRILVTEVVHELDQPVLGHLGSQDSAGYRNTFVAIPADRPFRPPRVTPKPRIPGLMTGLVQPGADDDVGRYARIDLHGRYVIQFLFDTTMPEEQKASRPVRKAQPTVGPDYGMHFPLRPGIEVVMAFVNGDPDRPIVLGALHNTRVPAHVRDQNSRQNIIKTASGIKMRFKDN